jgi:Uma2 family endonuclease
MAIHPPKAKLPRRPSYLSKYHGLRMTEEQYLALPEEKPYLEYVDGVALQKPMPNSQHGDLVGRITYFLGGYAELHGGKYRPEARVALGLAPNYRLPDTAYWAPGRLSGDDSLPTLAVEVRSPDQTLDELRTKCRFYRANGVDVCWLVDPASRTVEVFEGARDADRLPAEGTLESPLLPGFSVPLAKLFAVLDG